MTTEPRTTQHTFETTIQRGEYDLDIICRLDYYRGNERDMEDPNEVVVLEAHVKNDNLPYKKGQELIITLDEEDDIAYKFLYS